MKFEISSVDSKSKARAGKIFTDHGEILTPIFMPVGTLGTVKGVHQLALTHDIDAKIILGNTYHLYLRPGMEVIKKASGLHRFMGWERTLLTDSGGYQVFSLTKKRKISEEGVIFTSHIDGSKHIFTPEKVIDTQRIIGADIMMTFDECTPYPCSYEYARKSMSLTHRWLNRCHIRYQETKNLYNRSQVLFPIIQGSMFNDLRDESAHFVASQDFPGNALGGLSVGEPSDVMYGIVERVCDILPISKPRYLMGVGKPENILECIALGIDMFDCVIPTRNARNGMLFTTRGTLNIKNKKWATDFDPIDDALEGDASQNYSKAYLRHLIMSEEMLGAQIASIHNLTFYLWLVRKAREEIVKGTFLTWKNSILKTLSQKQ